MREIELTQGQVALVDDADYEELSKYKWYAHKDRNTYYATRNKEGRMIRMHRQLLGLTDPKIQADHIDGNGLNNQRNNLRVCSNAENVRNQRKQNRKTTSIYKGVSWHVRHNKWDCNIALDKKRIHLGYYQDEYIASIVYDLAAIKHFKEFANLNHPIENYIGKDLDSYFTKRIPTSKFTGVSWNKSNNKWKVTITINGKQTYIGYFTDEIDAAKAFDNAAMIHYGSDYPRFNFP